MTQVFFPISTAGQWQINSQLITDQLTPGLIPWLLEAESLTAKLKTLSREFKVEVLFEQRVTELAEQDQLPSELNDKAYLLRQVLLYCDDQPWVFASTVIPEKTLTQGNEFLAQLGNKPLGEALFQHPAISRDAFEICPFSTETSVSQLAAELGYTSTSPLWGRRSIFKLIDQPLLVCEIFLPACHAY